jgi:hypothetical protein
MSEETAKNTARQVAAFKANEERAALEQTWPTFQVEIEGDEVAWKARNDPQYWEQEDPDDPDTKWVAKKSGLPAHAKNVDGEIHMVARATVTCKAKTKEMAKMLALRDNPDYHTVNSVKKVGGEE